MKVTDVIIMLGAVATFLFGMNTMTSGLEQLTSGRLAKLLEKLTDNILKGVLLGAVVAGAVHSSAATTVMCIGFVNAGILRLNQAVGVIMGANIGTTITAQILRLGDISSDNLILSLLKPDMLGPMMLFLGILLFSSKKRKVIGQVLIGLGLLFIGIKSMESALMPLTEMESFRTLFVKFSNPFFGILAGALVTALVQSSTASVGILQALAANGMVTFATAVPIIMGQNIGTCITAIISSIGANRNAKRTAAVHLYFNVIGTTVFLILLYGLNAAIGFSFWDATMNRGSIADIHSIFNISCTVMLIPFNRLLVKLVEWTIPDDGKTEQVSTVLDDRFLSTPGLALDRAYEAVVQMGRLAKINYNISIDLLSKFDDKKLEELNENEIALDHLQDTLDNYLIRLSDHSTSLSPEDSARISELLHTLSDFERIGDYSVNLSESAQVLHERNLNFSPRAREELDAMTAAVAATVDRAVECYSAHSTEIAMDVEPIEEVVDLMRDELRIRHIERLKSGTCTIELGTQFLEMLMNLERISDHCSNIALYIIREAAPPDALIRMDAHAYMHALHHGENEEFDKEFQKYRKLYYAPIEFSNDQPPIPTDKAKKG